MMTQNEMQKKLEELTNNVEFMDRLAELDGLDKIAEALTAEGIETTVEDVKMMMKMAQSSGKDGELDADALSSVSGGGMNGYDFLWRGGIGCINYGIAIGNKIFKKNAPYIRY